MIVRIWGARGSVPTPGPATQRYGGNTSCVEVRGADPHSIVILDAGTGICVLGATMSADVRRVDILLTHLHLFKEDLIAAEHWRAAHRLCRDVDEADTPHVALALELDAPLWTGDARFDAGNGVEACARKIYTGRR